MKAFTNLSLFYVEIIIIIANNESIHNGIYSLCLAQMVISKSFRNLTSSVAEYLCLIHSFNCSKE